MAKKITEHTDAHGHRQTAVRERGRFSGKGVRGAAPGMSAVSLQDLEERESRNVQRSMGFAVAPDEWRTSEQIIDPLVDDQGRVDIDGANPVPVDASEVRVGDRIAVLDDDGGEYEVRIVTAKLGNMIGTDAGSIPVGRRTRIEVFRDGAPAPGSGARRRLSSAEQERSAAA